MGSVEPLLSPALFWGALFQGGEIRRHVGFGFHQQTSPAYRMPSFTTLAWSFVICKARTSDTVRPRPRPRTTVTGMRWKMVMSAVEMEIEIFHGANSGECKKCVFDGMVFHCMEFPSPYILAVSWDSRLRPAPSQRKVSLFDNEA